MNIFLRYVLGGLMLTTSQQNLCAITGFKDLKGFLDRAREEERHSRKIVSPPIMTTPFLLNMAAT